jgi:hypothetical protein
MNSFKVCTQCALGCISCNLKDGCLKTADGFYLEIGAIKKCQPFCKTCSNGIDCLLMKDDVLNGQVLTIFEGKVVQAQCQPGCLTCKPDNILSCLTCKDGLVLSTVSGYCGLCG